MMAVAYVSPKGNNPSLPKTTANPPSTMDNLTLKPNHDRVLILMSSIEIEEASQLRIAVLTGPDFRSTATVHPTID